MDGCEGVDPVVDAALQDVAAGLGDRHGRCAGNRLAKGPRSALRGRHGERIARHKTMQQSQFVYQVGPGRADGVCGLFGQNRVLAGVRVRPALRRDPLGFYQRSSLPGERVRAALRRQGVVDRARRVRNGCLLPGEGV